MIKRNAELNGVSVKVLEEDALVYLKETEETFDVVVVDPPKLVRSRSHLKMGLKKYRKINSVGLSRVQDGGFFVSRSCSSMVSEADFLRMLTEAAATSKRQLQVIHMGSQGPDHPFVAACPESRYLKVVFARVTAL